jgi:hypothetical protein
MALNDAQLSQVSLWSQTDWGRYVDSEAEAAMEDVSHVMWVASGRCDHQAAARMSEMAQQSDARRAMLASLTIALDPLLTGRQQASLTRSPSVLSLLSTTDRLPRVDIRASAMRLQQRWQPTITRLLGSDSDPIRMLVNGSLDHSHGSSFATSLRWNIDRLRQVYRMLVTSPPTRGTLGAVPALRASASVLPDTPSFSRAGKPTDTPVPSPRGGLGLPGRVLHREEHLLAGEGVSWQGVTAARLAQVARLSHLLCAEGTLDEGYDTTTSAVGAREIVWAHVRSLSLSDKSLQATDASGGPSSGTAPPSLEEMVLEGLCQGARGVPLGATKEDAGVINSLLETSGFKPARRDVLDFWGFIEALARIGNMRWGGKDMANIGEMAARAVDAVAIPSFPSQLAAPSPLGIFSGKVLMSREGDQL